MLKKGLITGSTDGEKGLTPNRLFGEKVAPGIDFGGLFGTIFH